MRTSLASRVALAAAVMVSVLAPIAPLAAQASSAPAAASALPLTASARREVVTTIGELLGRHYVDADTGTRIAKHLAARLTAGAYDAATDPYRFAELLSNDLRAINGDRHLSVGYDSREPGLRVGAEGIRIMGPPPSTAGGSVPRRAPPPGAGANARRSHFGLGRIDLLPGNVGYLDVRGFSNAPEAREAVVDALRYLQYTDAMIVDVRRNGGGSAELVNFLLSHFTGPDTIASVTVRNRSGNESFTRYTLPSVPGPRRPDVPLFVLTSGYTASAGEDFAFVLKNLGRATVVGEPTAGAGHNNAFLDSGHGFRTSISFTRVSDPKTGQEWERVGVQPSVRVDQDRALERAQSLALARVAETAADPEHRQVVEGIREAIEAQLEPRETRAATLASYVGEYEGGRRVSLRDGQLRYHPRPGAPADQLISLGDGRFALGAVRFRFEGTGAGAKLSITPPGQPTMGFARR